MQLARHASAGRSLGSSAQQRRQQQPCVTTSPEHLTHRISSNTGASSSSSSSTSSSMRQWNHQKVEQQQTQQPQALVTSRRGSLAMLSLGVAACFAAASVPPARAAAPNDANKALADYIAFDEKGKLKDKKALDDFRARYGIRRGIDGRVSLQSGSGDWYTARLDMEVPGAILLRREKDGAVFALETENLAQIDLSDDYIVLMMFADGAWERDMAPIEFEEETGAGGTAQLQLSDREFREFVGLLKELNEDDAATGGAPKS